MGQYIRDPTLPSDDQPWECLACSGFAELPIPGPNSSLLLPWRIKRTAYQGIVDYHFLCTLIDIGYLVSDSLSFCLPVRFFVLQPLLELLLKLDFPGIQPSKSPWDYGDAISLCVPTISHVMPFLFRICRTSDPWSKLITSASMVILTRA